jgi:hypothetical protein
MKWNFLLKPVLSLLLFTGCQGHFASLQDAPSAYIPYVDGDSDGRMTSFLVEAVEKEGVLRSAPSTARLTLKVKILDRKYTNIGFRYDPNRLKHQVKRVIPSESRSKLLAEVTVIDTASQKILLGPAHIVAYSDYDHQNYSINNDINVFSLGQLSDIDTASDSIDIASFRSLAREIAEYLHAYSNKLSAN